MNKRESKGMKRKLACLVVLAVLFPTDTTARAAAASQAVRREVTASEEPGRQHVRTSTASETPSATAATEPSTAPAVTQEPSETPLPGGTPPVETPAPLVRPKKISDIYLCAMGKHRVRLTWEPSRQASYYQIYRKKKGGGSFRLLGTAEKCSYLDKTVSFGQTYRYRVTPVAESPAEKKAGPGKCITFRNVRIVSADHQKYSYAEMSSDIRLLAKNYHGLVQYKVIGKSEDGRNIYDVVLGNPRAKKTMLVISTLHAREYMASLLCMNQVEYYLQSYPGAIDGKKVKNTLDQIAIHYVPMANPDGVTISQSGIGKIRSAALRKKLYRMRRGSTSRWKANARGVDLNRNFPYLFIRSGRRGSEGYTGPRAASEKETRALVRLLDDLKLETNLKGVINYHAMGSIVFGDCRKSGPLAGGTGKMYRLARKTTGYRSAAGYRGATSLGRGCCREYVMYGLFTPSITLEIGRRPCPGSIREFPSIWRKNRKLVLREARIFL